MFTFDQIVKATEAVVAESGPDTLYKQRVREEIGGVALSCRYLILGQPACLVGVVMDRLGLDRGTLARWDEAEDGSFRAVAIDPELGIDIEHRAVVFLGTAQSVQDDNRTWGDALRFAKDAVA